MFNSTAQLADVRFITEPENMVIGLLEGHNEKPSAITGCGIIAQREKVLLYFFAAFLFFVPIFTDHSACESRIGVAPEWKNAEWCWAPWSAWVSESASIFDTLPHQAPHSFVSPHTHTYTTPHLQHTPKSIFMHTNSREKFWKDFNVIKQREHRSHHAHRQTKMKQSPTSKYTLFLWVHVSN